jgi:hypothetical protein
VGGEGEGCCLRRELGLRGWEGKVYVVLEVVLMRRRGE